MTKIPKEIVEVIKKLRENNFEAFLVGGCVRDFLRGEKPKDWDITTNAKPEEIQKIFPDSFYENDFGTVGVKTGSDDETLKVVEVTPFRLEAKYSDKRHPDKIEFAQSLADDIGRRDFTINALAMALGKSDFPRKSDFQIIDLVGGKEDLKNKIIRAVGEPAERFQEDALRLLRAVRFSAELDFTIEERTREAVKKNAGLLKFISKERIRDEFVKLIMSEGAAEGIEFLRESGLLKEFLPELLEGVGVGQNLHHVFTVWEHNLKALEYTVKKGYSFEVKLASLLHDIAKPRAKRGEGKFSTFYGHDVLGAKMSAKILERLRFPKDFSEKVIRLVRWHLFYYNVGEVTESSVRRVLRNVGPDLIEDLIRVREADRIGSGVPKAVPYKLRHFKFMVEKVQKDPISVGMLKVKGDDVMKILRIRPGPKVGMALSALLEEVLQEPKKNTKEYLIGRIKELGELSEAELKKLAESGKEKKEEVEASRDRELKEKFWVA
ncbi:hypothetical protein A2757_03275 [Candidatus Giovannonibacteria bacterium RIFCSPHIGHO2_01_FULL_48_47]|nr:MAG: hypothetical protein A2757_03275 [Candidatus Giovannonibacteria bacterium RIFCSPHIGHO2_01_FULL_48_47]OGF68762.1 MAG: hypothetical protein A3D61_01585 [Candidatus Giovannonibacteria bacterium RIFCSPHIGHO2_02_FULL_48_15]OGF88574.1 MAG: hypothetical protein A3B26_02340 [Candidatus Giovannonibacteria bacterium RIFCSPLOWO2_01_FULL_48_47]OGF94988.1 MAG: hypothetical protein A2433_02000 [Candidatus Giovannonibacteria bacterium RIFOXYC1_FULL_48_8]OGF96303.1 MAG: hypothetical protein A2613_01955